LTVAWEASHSLCASSVMLGHCLDQEIPFLSWAAAASCGLPVTFAIPSRTAPEARLTKDEADEGCVLVLVFPDMFSCTYLDCKLENMFLYFVVCLRGTNLRPFCSGEI
jgi:hypothetical protein